MKVKIKIIGKIGYTLAIFFLALIAGIVAISALNLPSGVRLYTVQSGSMEPALSIGSLVIVKPQETYQKNQVITFKSKADINNPRPENTTTHRIVDVREVEEQQVYITKGDANDAEDIDPVLENQVIGSELFSIPWIGHIVSFARTREGLISLIVVPAVVIIYSEIINIKKELVRIYRKIKISEQIKAK